MSATNPRDAMTLREGARPPWRQTGWLSPAPPRRACQPGHVLREVSCCARQDHLGDPATSPTPRVGCCFDAVAGPF